MDGRLMALGAFIGMAAIVMGFPLIVWLAAGRNWAIVNAIRERPRLLHVAQAIFMLAFAVTGLLGRSEPELKWLIVGIGVLGFAAATAQAVVVNRRQRDVRSL